MNLLTASLVSCLYLVDSTSKGVPICNGNGQLILIVKKETVMLCSSNSANCLGSFGLFGGAAPAKFLRMNVKTRSYDDVAHKIYRFQPA